MHKTDLEPLNLHSSIDFHDFPDLQKLVLTSQVSSQEARKSRTSQSSTVSHTSEVSLPSQVSQSSSETHVYRPPFLSQGSYVLKSTLSRSSLTISVSYECMDEHPRVNPQTEEDLDVLRVKSSSALNLQSFPQLHHQPSKLDLIDDTTLTSLPLPPPPPKNQARRGDLAASIPRSSVSDPSEPASFSVNDVDTIHEISDDYDTSVQDDTFEENHDPIVLIEDYMASSNQCMTRKASLATFKLRHMGKCRSVAHLLEPQFRPGAKRSISTDNSWLHHLQTEDLEAIFGKIPGTDKLKHCDLCDKPLYEISTVISSKDNDINMSQLYNEFVCWECINVYEQFLSELYETEVSETSIQYHNTCATERLLCMFNSIRETHTVTVQPPRKHCKTGFSLDLLDKLHTLSSMAEPRPNGDEWLVNLRRKLRWRWRLYNVLPNPFA